jgi:hypothetical protein
MLLLTTLDESIESEAATRADTLCHARLTPNSSFRENRRRERSRTP